MTIPYRDFSGNAIDIWGWKAHDPDSVNFQAASDWEDIQYPGRIRIGQSLVSTNNAYKEKTIFKPKFSGLPESLDQSCHLGIEIIWGRETITGPAQCNLYLRTINIGYERTVDFDRFTGRKANTIQNWQSFDVNQEPPRYIDIGIMGTAKLLYSANQSENFCLIVQAYVSGNAWNDVQDSFFGPNGFGFFVQGDYSPIIGVGDEFWGSLQIQRIKVHYFNSIINSLSRYAGPSAGGEEIIFYGDSFSIPIAELRAVSGPSVNWDHHVTSISFIGTEGQGTYTVNLLGVTFTIDSNNQVTVLSRPKMKPGAYEIYVTNREHLNGINSSSYAGDWKVDKDGLITEGEERILYYVLDIDRPLPPEPQDDPIVPGINIKNWFFSEIDISAMSTFWDGRILNLSSLKRSVDDRSGLLIASDLTVDLANSDKFFSKILFSENLKNEYANIYRLHSNTPEALKDYVLKMIIEDYDLEGNIFKLYLKDVIQKYFRIKVPFQICTEDEFPNIFENHIGRSKPEILGEASLTTDPYGAVEAVYVDTVNFKYLAAAHVLHAIPQVYSDGDLQVVGAEYSVQMIDGETILVFVSDQGNNKITFNAEGYMVFDWNGPGGYIQNPAYVLAYYLKFIMGFPDELMNYPSFDDLAQIYTDISEDRIGKLILQNPVDPKTPVQEMNFSFGCNIYRNNEGKVSADRKDFTNYQTDLILYEQIHSKDHASKPFNLRDAVNYAKCQFNHFPNAQLYTGVKEYTYQKSIDDLLIEIEPDSPFQLPWITSETFAYQRIWEELQKRGYGDKKISFQIPSRLLDEIDLLQNFRYQDPFGISATGVGEIGRYYYIESIELDWHNELLRIVGADLQWLIRQCMIIGREAEIPRNWADASEEQRLFGYVGSCSSGAFPDGEPNKKVCKCS